MNKYQNICWLGTLILITMYSSDIPCLHICNTNHTTSSLQHRIMNIVVYLTRNDATTDYIRVNCTVIMSTLHV